jgi:hypothetical protein
MDEAKYTKTYTVTEYLLALNTLGVPTEYTLSNLTKAKRDLNLKHHPDRNPGNPFCIGLTQEINSAFEILNYFLLQKEEMKRRVQIRQEQARKAEQTKPPSQSYIPGSVDDPKHILYSHIKAAKAAKEAEDAKAAELAKVAKAAELAKVAKAAELAKVAKAAEDAKAAELAKAAKADKDAEVAKGYKGQQTAKASTSGISTRPCWNGIKCTKANCPFLHYSKNPCKYGVACKFFRENQYSCVYSHNN